ncbi:prolyl-tRNA synthetase associated domain-containing protein [Xanthobacter sediminis]
MPLTPDALIAFLAEHRIAAETFHHPPLHTVAESKALRGAVPGAQTKNLFLRDSRKNYFLVTLAADAQVNLKSLREPLGARGSLSFASPEALYECLGVLPGSVTLLALANDPDHRVTVAIDAALLRAEAVGCHPLVNERTTVLTPAALRAFLALTGHVPVELEIAQEPEG